MKVRRLKLEVSTEEKTKASVRLKHAAVGSHALELKLDELRKELTMFSKTKTHRKR
jgi:hypothetical protein